MKWTLWVLYMGFPLWGSTQNLVKNPSFERYLECPKALGTFHTQVNDWSTPSLGSTDYFNTCSSVMGPTKNFNGGQEPYSGKAYAGMYFYAPGEYREYVQVPLKRPLQKGKTYRLTFYVSLAEASDYALRDFGVALSYKKLHFDRKKALSKGQLFQTKGNHFQLLEINAPQFHTDPSVWRKLELSITGKGFENYLILGNFRNNTTTRKVPTRKKQSKKGAYYYLDMVSLTPLAKGPHPAQLNVDSLYVLQNVRFDVDQFRIDDRAHAELDLLLEKLRTNDRLHLQIHGHTDSSGTPSYNQQLSEKRAKEIADYLIAKGIKAHRISWWGHGAQKPVASNSSEKDRAKNRRVEFHFSTVSY